MTNRVKVRRLYKLQANNLKYIYNKPEFNSNEHISLYLLDGSCDDSSEDNSDYDGLNDEKDIDEDEKGDDDEEKKDDEEEGGDEEKGNDDEDDPEEEDDDDEEDDEEEDDDDDDDD